MTEKVFGTEKKGSLRDIPLPADSVSGNTLDLQDKRGDNFDNWSNMKRKNKRSGSKIIGALVVILLLIGLYSYFFHSGEVVVKSTQQQVTVAGKEFNASISPTEGQIEFIRVNPYKKTESLYIEGSTEENKQTKTTGTITVYNTDSSEKTYIKNTRFQTEDGLVFRAFKRFTLPKGTVGNPGSTEVVVVAENPGEKYNSEAGFAFTLPALKEQNDPSFDRVFARQTEPLEGGFSGVIRVPTIDDINEAKIKLRAKIEQDLEKDFAASLPDNYIVNKDYIEISEVEFVEKPNEAKGGIDLEARATLDSVVFKKEMFESFLASQLIEDYKSGTAIVIDNINQLTMEIEEEFDPKLVESFTFTVVGNVQFRTPVDTDAIKQAVAGKLKSHITSGLIGGLELVQMQDVAISPFWRRSMPANIEDIAVVVVE